MRRKNILLLGLILLALSLLGFIFTYVYSNSVAYSLSGRLFLSESSAHSYLVPVKPGDIITVSGNSTHPIDVIVIGVVPKVIVENGTSFEASTICVASGTVYVMFRTLPYTNITEIDFNIKVYNSWFSGIGYIASSFILLMSLFVLGYYILLTRRRVRKRRR